jgi:NAD-dependent SIR2 family protein deacetylase
MNTQTHDITQEIEKARMIIQDADTLLITAGAGMGVDSGLPDFRGNEGFWNAYPAAKKRHLSFSSLANPEWFKYEPLLAWAFYGHRLHLYRETVPHSGFSMLLDVCRSKNNDYFIVTSNVDGQFQKAGFDSDKICEIHGSIHHFQCAGAEDHGIWDTDGENIEIDMDVFTAIEPYPVCPKCAKIARPNIMMFNDWHWISERSDAQMKRFSRWKHNIVKEKKKVAVIEIGAGTSISSIRRMSESAAKQFKTSLIRINPRESQGLLGTIKLPFGGLEGLSWLLKEGYNG